MTDTEQRILEMHGMMKVVVSDSAAMKKTLYGNGQPGVTDRLTIIEQKQKNCVALKGHARSNVLLMIQIIVCGAALASIIINFAK